MKSEFKRLFSSKSIIISWIILLIALVMIAALFVINQQYTLRGNTIQSYENQAQLQEIVQTWKNNYELATTAKDKDRAAEVLAFYEYLLDHSIAYEDFRAYNEMSIYEANQSNFIALTTTYSTMVIALFLIFISLKIFNEDYSYKTDKYVYTRNVKPIKIWRNKMLCFMAITGAVFLLDFLVILAISFNYSNDYTYLIFQNGTDVNGISVIHYIVLSFVFFFLDIVLYFIAFTAIASFGLNMIKTFVLSLILPVLIFIFNGINQIFTGFLFQTGVIFYRYYPHIGMQIGGYAVRIVLMLALGAGALVYFILKYRSNISKQESLQE